MGIRQKIALYRQDPLIGRLWDAVKSAPPMRSISVDITHRCNLRCKGCYFFGESMDDAAEASDTDLEAFIQREKLRGVTFATVIGGEPSLSPDRLRLMARHFRIMVVTNGLRPLPQNGLEDISIAISMWGDREVDRSLRGYGKIDIFDRALRNYEGDDRARWYITLPASPSEATVEVVDSCAANGNLVSFNYYGDLENLGNDLDHRRGFENARAFVDRMIDRHPTAIATTRYLNDIVTGGTMLGEAWGYSVCGSVSVDSAANKARLANGKSYNPFFNAYGPDLKTPRRCCVGETRDCSTCFDVWAHMSWIAMSIERHVEDEVRFFNWLSTMAIFYGSCRYIDPVEFSALIPKIHQRSAMYRDEMVGISGRYSAVSVMPAVIQ